MAVRSRAGAARVRVVRLELPRVPLDRAVDGELEHVPGSGERLAAGRAVDEREQPAAGVELRSQVRVLEHEPVDPHGVVGLHRQAEPVRRRLDHDQLAAGVLGHLAPGERREVERRRVGAGLAERSDGGVAQARRARGHRGVVALGVFVDRVDRAARQDVVELVEQQRPPQRAQLVRRVRRSPQPKRQRGRRLGLVQQPLARAVAALGARLARVRPAVELEVQLADQRRRVRQLLREPGEERVARADLDLRHALQVARSAGQLEHLRHGPSPAVAVSEHQQARRRAVVVAVARRRGPQLGDRDLRVVGVGGREVREHRRAVDALPAERVVRRARELVPRELLGQEAVDPGAPEDLRHLPVVAERVRAPVLAAAPPEPRLERTLAVEQLPHERLARRQVAVRLHPRAADDLPPSFTHALAHAREQIRRVLLEPRVVLRGGRREPVLRVALHEHELVRERADDLAARLGERPQPRGVEMGVADRRHPVHAPGVAVGEQRGEDLPRARLLPGLPHGAEAVELGQQETGPGGLEIGLGLELAQRLEVPRRLPRRGVEAHELAAREPHRVVVAHPRVAGHLDGDLDPLAARRARR